MISKILDILNDLRPRQIFMLAGVSTLLMFGVAYLAFSFLAPQETAETSPAPQQTIAMESVVMARSDIAAHTILNENMLQVRQIPADLVPIGALRTIRSAVGRPAGVSIYAGDVITDQKLYMESMQTGFTDSIPVDCRAVSVGVSNITGVAGFAKAGDHVDVIFVQKDEQSAASRLLLQNVLLLSINKDAGGNASSLGAAAATAQLSQEETKELEDPAIATLALLPQEAMELVSAVALGEIYLVLRPSRPSETSVVQTDYTLQSMVKPVSARPAASAAMPSPAPIAPSSAPVPAPDVPEPVSSGIEIIQGDKIVQK